MDTLFRELGTAQPSARESLPKMRQKQGEPR